ncbi:Piso0_004945 [Millerozyma farinosa CBS 7064]|uniref:Piso0_004945 protein n=1 Tax=Pichia sorbitophila (strain ATCC MYA-4447 / BCRC 22081 / CBS 7064 / NBRC 10061 / NRRL Y-12695) TaxID=559304 RepID=G8Y3T7_PICSO|nr:Piso0_004945 [Millerozyma farinosa CBS 7064]
MSPSQFALVSSTEWLGGFEGPAQSQKRSASSHKTEHGRISDDSTQFSGSGNSLRKKLWPLQRWASHGSYARKFTGGDRGGP